VNALWLAWAHIRFHPWRTAVMVAAVALILAAPVTIGRLLGEAQARMTARAAATPLLLGARGGRLDLVMHALYFEGDRPERLPMAAADAIWDGGLADAVPLHLRFTAEGAPVVGTTLDYFAFRGLEVAAGRSLAVLGEAVLGAAVAGRLGLGPGDAIVSDPENLFDLDGAYPLRMPVVGVLAPTGGPDDAAVFVDVKTAWVIEGVGHGHDDVVAPNGAPDGAPDGAAAVADPALRPYREVTAETIESFHFHGDPAAFPIDAVIALPHDARSATILRGRYLGRDAAAQMVEPGAAIRGLFERVFRIKRVLDAVIALTALAAALGVGLALWLSLELRRDEMETAFRIGGRRGTIARLAAAESVIILCLAICLAAGIVALTDRLAAPAAMRLLAAA
jgi:putative ABC transport system permease protein